MCVVNMQSIFEEFASFGSNRANSQNAATLDSRQFVKFCTDNGWIDNDSFPKTAADLLWTKIMRKERKMDFGRFKQAVEEIARRKNVTIDELITNLKGPVKNNITEFADDAWVKRQTDHTLYTGAHKLKFDSETGKGLGLAGRIDTHITDLSDVTNRGKYDIRGRNIELLEKQQKEKQN